MKTYKVFLILLFNAIATSVISAEIFFNNNVLTIKDQYSKSLRNVSGSEFIKLMRDKKYRDFIGAKFNIDPMRLSNEFKSHKNITYSDLIIRSAILHSQDISKIVKRVGEIDKNCLNSLEDKAEYKPLHVIIPSKTLITVGVNESDTFWAKAFKLPNYTPEPIIWYQVSAQPTRVDIDKINDEGARAKFKVTGLIAGSHTNVRVGKNGGRGGPGDPDHPDAPQPPLMHSLEVADVNVLVDRPLGNPDDGSQPPTGPDNTPTKMEIIGGTTATVGAEFRLFAVYYNKDGDLIQPLQTRFIPHSKVEFIGAGLDWGLYRFNKFTTTCSHGSVLRAENKKYSLKASFKVKCVQ